MGTTRRVARSRTRRRLRAAGALLLVAVAYGLASWAVALPLGLAPRGHLPTCACADVAQEVWLLAVAAAHPFAFHTDLIDVPRGVGLLDNASFPLIGVLAEPLTRAAGPVAALVILLRASFFASAVGGYAALRWVRRGRMGALVGGALYAFSPFMTHQGASHFFLVLGPFLPLLLALTYRVLAGWHRRPWVAGIAAGLLAVAQFFVDSEVLIMAAVAVAAVVVLWLLWLIWPFRRLRPLPRIGPAVPTASLPRPAEAARRVATFAATTLAAALPFLAYPAWVALQGPDRLIGPTQPNAGGVGLAATFLPGDRSVVAGLWSGWRVPVGQYLGHNSYVGLVLILACALAAARHWRDPLVRAAVALVAVAWVLSLGGHLTWTVRPTGVPLPFDALQHLPILQDLIPDRFSLLVDLGLAVIAAAGIDGGWTAARRGHLPFPEAGLVVLLVAGLVLAAPARGYGSFPVGPAAAFAGPSSPVDAVPAGAVALTYPIPQFPQDQAMLWQAESGLRFRLIGGYAIRPGPGRRSDRLPLLPPPVTLPRALEGALERPASFAPGSSAWSRAAAALPGFLQARHVRTVIVDRAAPAGGAVATLFRHRLGPPATVVAGVDVWVVGVRSG